MIPNQPRINVRVTDEELKAFSLKAGSHVIDDQRLVQTPDAAKQKSRNLSGVTKDSKKSGEFNKSKFQRTVV